MKSLFIDNTFAYDGSQLRSLFAYMEHGLLGDSVVSWIGPCHIPFDHMVDGEDLRVKSPIEGSQMVHFIVEKFNVNLFSGVALQRMMAAIVKDYLSKNTKIDFLRDGDDIFWEDKKLSISIATQSPTSTLIHFAVNVSNEGTPVKTACLEEMDIDPKAFSQDIMQLFSQEVETIEQATQKVFWVK